MTISYIYIFCICFLTALCSALAFKLYQFSMIILDIETAIEECLDLLDQKYKNMSEVVQKPIFFDSVEVRQVISDIKDCHNSVLVVANKLTRQSGMISETEEKNK